VPTGNGKITWGWGALGVGKGGRGEEKKNLKIILENNKTRRRGILGVRNVAVPGDPCHQDVRKKKKKNGGRGKDEKDAGHKETGTKEPSGHIKRDVWPPVKRPSKGKKGTEINRKKNWGWR